MGRVEPIEVFECQPDAAEREAPRLPVDDVGPPRATPESRGQARVDGAMEMEQRIGGICVVETAEVVAGGTSLDYAAKSVTGARRPATRSASSDTPPGEDPVQAYLHEISKHPLLTKDDEVRLAGLIEAGNKAREHLGAHPDLSADEQQEYTLAAEKGDRAQEQFITANLRLVVSIAKGYQNNGLPLLDLIQEGNFGLMHAVEKFDHRKGFKFSTYATWWIRQAISGGIAKTGRAIRLPVSTADMLASVQKASGLLEGEMGRQPTAEELAKNLGLPLKDVEETLQLPRDPVSLSDPLGGEGDTVRGDLIVDTTAESPPDVAIRGAMVAEVAELLAPLDARTQEIIRLRFGLDSGEGLSREIIAGRFDLTHERIRQIESRALRRLKVHANGSAARELLELF